MEMWWCLDLLHGRPQSDILGELEVKTHPFGAHIQHTVEQHTHCPSGELYLCWAGTGILPSVLQHSQQSPLWKAGWVPGARTTDLQLPAQPALELSLL